jgi:hypothetical protein
LDILRRRTVKSFLNGLKETAPTENSILEMRTNLSECHIFGGGKHQQGNGYVAVFPKPYII